MLAGRRVLVVTDATSDGGCGRHLGYLIDVLAANRAAVTLASFDPRADWSGLPPVRVERFDAGVAPETLIDALQRPPPGFAALLDAAAWDLVAVSDSCCFANLGPRAEIAARRLPMLCIEHNAAPELRRAMSDRQAERLATIYAASAAVVAVSAFTAAALEREFGCPAARLRVVGNPVRPEFFAPRDAAARAAARAGLGVAADRRLVLTVGHVVDYKGIGVLFDFLAACAPELRARRLRFAWVGEGDRREAACAAAVRLGLDDLAIFPGWRGDIAALLDGADLLLHPALVEAFGIGVAEAMAKGVPVVAFAVGGVPEVVGASGVLLPPPGGAAEETRRSLLGGIDAAIAGMPTLAAAGRARAAATFGFDRFAAAMTEVFAAVLRPAVSSPPR